MSVKMPDKLYSELCDLGLNFRLGVFPGWSLPDYNNMRTGYYYGTYLQYHDKQFGKLHVIAYDPNHVAAHIAARKQSYRKRSPDEMITSWKKYNTNILCYCECGNLTYVKPVTLNRRNSNGEQYCNCGCDMKNIVSKSNQDRAKHGLTGTRIAMIWRDMLYRCTNPNAINYMDYGGRGISICKEWYDPNKGRLDHTEELKAFAKWAYEHGFYEQDTKEVKGRDLLTIDRIDTNGDYEPGNVRFIPKSDQAYNRRSTTVVFFKEPNGAIRERTVVGLVEQYHVNSNRVHKRLDAGFSPYNAVTMPTRYTRRKEKCKPLPRDPSTYDQYDGPRYNEHGELRDKDGFIILDWKKDIHAIIEGYKKNKDSKD